MKSQGRIAALVFALLFISMTGAMSVFAIPEGVDNITVYNSTRRTPGGGAPISAQAGNISLINITARRQTSAWQGFAGNITGNLVLDDASADRFYSWNLTNVSGEIYFSRNASINFNNVFPQNNCTIDEELTLRRADRVSRTFTNNSNVVNFSVGTIAINTSTACATWPFVNSSPQTTLFENIILSAETNNATNFSVGGNQSIYVGLLQEAGTAGFDTHFYNFQVLVPVNRTSGFNTYYVYAEME